MKQVIKGKQARLDVKIGAEWLPVLCAMECSFEFDFEVILITSRNSTTAREKMTRFFDWSFSVNGLTKIDNADGQAGFLWFAQQSVRGTQQYMRMHFTDDDGNTQDIYGYVLISRGQLAAVVGGFANGSLTFPGTGDPEIGTVGGLLPTDIYYLYLSTTAGAYEVSHADLGGALEILLVIREDWGAGKETTGTPVNKEFKFIDNTTSGTIRFASASVFNAGEVVYVEYRK